MTARERAMFLRFCQRRIEELKADLKRLELRKQEIETLLSGDMYEI